MADLAGEVEDDIHARDQMIDHVIIAHVGVMNLDAVFNAPQVVHVAALFGGAWLLPQILSDEALRTFQMSVQHFKEATRRGKVDVLLQNHMLMDPIQDKLEEMSARTPRDPNPFVVGAAPYQKFLDVMDGCTRVNIARRQA